MWQAVAAFDGGCVLTCGVHAANKQDLPNARRAPELIDKLGLLDLKEREKDKDWFLQECSASAGTGIDKGLDWLASCLSKRVFDDEAAE